MVCIALVLCFVIYDAKDNEMRTFRCIVCKEEVIEPLYFDESQLEHIERGPWLNGVVEVATMPYGSKFDGEQFVFAICDKCIEKLYSEGIIGKKEIT